MQRRRNRKGRAMGGIILGIRKDIALEIKQAEWKEEGIVTGKVVVGKEKWRIVGVYVREDREKKLEELRKWLEGEEGEEITAIIGGDFNAKTGEMGGRIVMEEGEEDDKNRNCKDKKVNKEGWRLVEVLEEAGWSILNGSTKGDEKGEYTYTGGKGNTVIDYVIGDERIREEVVRLEVGEETDSDHHPVVCWIKGAVKGRKEKVKKGSKKGV